MVETSKSTGWQTATTRTRAYYMLDTPPGSLLALTLHLIAARAKSDVADVSLANVRYELSDPATLHAALNGHCPPIALPESPEAVWAVPNWPRHPAADPVQMRRAWLLVNASGPDITPYAWPKEAQVIPYAAPDDRDAFFPRAVDSLRRVLDEALLSQVDGPPLHSEVHVVGGAHDGLHGRVGAVMWELDHALRRVTAPASYRVYGPGTADVTAVPAATVQAAAR